MNTNPHTTQLPASAALRRLGQVVAFADTTTSPRISRRRPNLGWNQPPRPTLAQQPA